MNDSKKSWKTTEAFFFDEILHCNKMMLSENKGENDQTLICWSKYYWNNEQSLCRYH